MSAERTFPYTRAIDLLVGEKKMDLFLKGEEVEEKGPFCMMVNRCPQCNALYPICPKCDYHKQTLADLEKDLNKRLEKEPNILESKHEIMSFRTWGDGIKGVGHALFRTTLGWELSVSQGLGISVAEFPDKKVCWGTYIITVKPIDFKGMNLNIPIKTDEEIRESLRKIFGAWRAMEILGKREKNMRPNEKDERLKEQEKRRFIDKKLENYTNFIIERGIRHARAVGDLLGRK